MPACHATKGAYWTPADDARLIALRRQKEPRLKTPEIARLMGRTVKAIYERENVIARYGART